MLYRASNILQGLLWLFGFSWHNPVPKEGGECCPDFSCCYKSIKSPLKSRLVSLWYFWVTRPLRPLYYRIFHPSVSQTKLCSGYQIFPGGEQCPGCIDCYPKRRKQNGRR